MKNPLDKRHVRRQNIVEDLFKIGFHKQPIGKDAQRVVDSQAKIDKFIKKAAPQFSLDKINKVDLSILRLAIFELFVEKSQPPSVIIDEAIELAKEYGGETSPGFVNGALGKLVKNDTATKI